MSEELIVVSLMYLSLIVLMCCHYRSTKKEEINLNIKMIHLEDRVSNLETQSPKVNDYNDYNDYNDSNYGNNYEELMESDFEVSETLIQNLNNNPSLVEQEQESNSINKIEEAANNGIRGLKKLASEVKLPKYSKMTKSQLYTALVEYIGTNAEMVEV